MNRRLGRLSLGLTFIANVALAVPMFVIYGGSWRDQMPFVVLSLLLLFVVYLDAWRKIALADSLPGIETEVKLISWVCYLGTVGMGLALLSGHHVSASLVVHVGIAQSILMLLVMKKIRDKQHTPGN
jgi:hypothetical protein